MPKNRKCTGRGPESARGRSGRGWGRGRGRVRIVFRLTRSVAPHHAKCHWFGSYATFTSHGVNFCPQTRNGAAARPATPTVEARSRGRRDPASVSSAGLSPTALSTSNHTHAFYCKSDAFSRCFGLGFFRARARLRYLVYDALDGHYLGRLVNVLLFNNTPSILKNSCFRRSVHSVLPP